MCAHRPIPVTLTLPSRFGKWGGNSVPSPDLGLNTDNGPPERGQLELGESESGVSNDFRKIFLCLNDQMLVRLAVCEGGKWHPFS